MTVVRRNNSNICKENYRRIFGQVYEHDLGWGLYILSRYWARRRRSRSKRKRLNRTG
jgi:hypothetical protein